MVSTALGRAIFAWYGINRVQIASPLGSLHLTSAAVPCLLRVYVVCLLRALGHTQVLTAELQKEWNMHSLMAFSSSWWWFRKGANFLYLLCHIRPCEFAQLERIAHCSHEFLGNSRLLALVNKYPRDRFLN